MKNTMKNIKIVFLILLFLCLLCPYSLAQPKIELEESVWDLRSVSKGEVIEKIFKIKNTGKDKLIIKKVQPGCDCIGLYILTSEAESGEFASVKAVFDSNSKEVKNKFTKYFYIQSNDPNRPVVRISIVGVLGKEIQIEKDVREKSIAGKSEDKIKGGTKVILFYSPGCMGCRRVKDIFLADMRDKYKEDIEVESYDISVLENYLRLIEFEEKYGVEENDPMIVFAGDRYFSGRKAILSKLEPYVNDLIKAKKIEYENLKKLNKEKLLDRFRSFSPFIIFSAGFIDGLNPCAFVTVVFLISFLLLAEKNRKEVFLIGIVFSLAALLSYLLIGLGLRSVLHRLLIFNVISDVIYVSAICLVFALAFYSLYDAFVYFKYGDTKNVKLKLPEMFIKKIHDIIRRNIGGRSLIISVFFAGFLISLLESICTGQVYLPTIMFVIKEPSMRGSSFLYLVLYNIAFIIPLLTVIILAVLGVSTGRFIAFSKKNTFATKISMAILFIVIGVLLILVR